MFSPRKALSFINSFGEWQSIRYVNHKAHHLVFRDAHPEVISSSWNEGAMIEVFVDGHFSYSATSDLSEKGLIRAAEKAHRLAKLASARSLHSFTTDIRHAARGVHSTPGIEPLTTQQLGEIKELLAQACSELKVSDQIISTFASIGLDEIQTHFVSSSGADTEQSFSGVMSQFEATAQKNGETQSRSDKGMYARCYQGGFESLIPTDIHERCRLAGLGAIELLEAENCPDESMDLILLPDQMMLQIHESIGHPLELDRILGDERNFAGWSFVRPEDFGQLQYGSELMNVSFDPSDATQYATYAFDDAGSPSKKEYLIKDGKLLRGLGGSESQMRLGVNGVANARAEGWNRPPIDRMANINLEAGTTSMDEMISSTQRGIVMQSNRSWSIDDYRNKFQFGCEYAQLIEDGQLTKVVKNPNYRGSTLNFWRSLEQVGDLSTYESFGTPFCGKGEPNQVIRVSHGSPACKFRNIEVFGA